MFTSKKVRHKLSKWRAIDMCALIILLIFSIVFISYHCYQILLPAAIFVLIAVILMRPLYYQERERSKTFRNITAAVRAVGYAIVVIAIILPFTLNNDWKWYYQVQKLVYGMNEETERFLPERIPENSEKYDVIFTRSGFPGASRIEISFFADSQTIAEYRDKALKNGAVSSCKNVSKERWYNEMAEQNVPYEQAEYYFYPGAGEWYPKVYILEETTGYVKIYW